MLMSSQGGGAKHLKPAKQRQPTREREEKKGRKPPDLRHGSGWPASAGSRDYAPTGGDACAGFGAPPAQAARSRAAVRLEKRQNALVRKGRVLLLKGQMSPVSPALRPGCLFFS